MPYFARLHKLRVCEKNNKQNKGGSRQISLLRRARYLERKISLLSIRGPTP